MMSTFRHPEAFRLLRYRCESCGFVEVVWNSRDGRVAKTIECSSVSGEIVDEHDAPVGPYQDSIHRIRAAYRTRIVAETREGPFALDIVEADLPAPCGGVASLRTDEPQWIRDFKPRHDPLPGERYFRDGIPAEARAIMRTRIEHYRRDAATVTAPGNIKLPPMTDQWERELIDWAGSGSSVDDTEFAPGWPMLVVRGSDADGLPMRASGQRPTTLLGGQQ